MINSNYDIDIENAVIGSILTWYEKLKSNIGLISENDFYINSDLFKLIKQQYDSNFETIDIILLISNVAEEEKPKLKIRIKQALETAVSVHTFSAQLARLKEISQKRRLNSKIYDLYLNGCTLEDIQKVVEEEKQNSTLSGAIEIGNKNLEEYIENVGTKKETIKTGFSTLDSVLGGLRLGTVAHIGARPSTGKTALALNIVKNQKNKTVVFSLEMSNEMIFERMASSYEMIEYSDFTKQRLNQYQIDKIKNRMSEIRQRENLFVYDDIYNIERMATTILEVKPQLVVIDYIQKVTTTQKLISTRERIEYISGELKRIAKYNNCCIVALSQLSRDGKEAPTMSSLKESGALEADGDYIMLIHRPYVLNKKDQSISPETTELLIDKNKFGSTGKIDLCFKGQYQQFFEIEKNRADRNVREYEAPPF